MSSATKSTRPITTAPLSAHRMAENRGDHGHRDQDAAEDEDDALQIIENAPEERTDDAEAEHAKNQKKGTALPPELQKYVDEAFERQKKSAEKISDTQRDLEASEMDDSGNTIVEVMVSSDKLKLPEGQRIAPMLARVLRKHTIGRLHKAWLSHARIKGGLDIPADEEPKYILTWNLTRLYQSNSMATLGVEPDERGVFRDRHGVRIHAAKDGYSQGRLFLEVYVDTVFDKFIENKRRQREKVLTGDFWDETEMQELMEEINEKQQHEERERARAVTVHLRAKDFAVVHVVAKPEWQIAVLLEQFRAKTGVAADKTVTAVFDGDVMDPELTLAETEIDADDQVEIYVK